MPNQAKMHDLPVDQIPAVYHRRLGDLVVSTVSDGYADPPLDVIQGVSQAEVTRLMLAGLGKPTMRSSVNTFAVRSAEKTYLIDAGSGTTMGPTMGRLPDNLAIAGIALEDVDAILLTHVHPDRLEGCFDSLRIGRWSDSEGPRGRPCTHAQSFGGKRVDTYISRV